MSISWKKLQERANQVTGFQLPIIGAGLSWQPNELDITKARKLITFLEFRNVLFEDFEWEHVQHSIDSVMEIKKYLVEGIMIETNPDAILSICARELIKACDEFRKRTYRLEKSESGFYDYKDKNYNILQFALGRFRRQFATWIAVIAIKYEVDIDENLARIIPLSPNHEADLLKEKME